MLQIVAAPQDDKITGQQNFRIREFVAGPSNCRWNDRKLKLSSQLDGVGVNIVHYPRQTHIDRMLTPSP